MGLGDILQTYKHDNKDNKGIKNKLDRYLIKRGSTVDIGRSYEDERKNNVHHPSALASNDCLRSMVFKWVNAEKTDEEREPKVQRIFNTGHDNGYRMQGYFYEMGILLGKWHCVECKHEWLDMEEPSPKICPNCGVEFDIWYNLHYLEVPIIDSDKNIYGSADTVLARSWGRQLVELKTIKNKPNRPSKYGTYFEDLQQPKESHRLQCNLYTAKAQEQYGQKTEEDFKHGLVVYSAKNDQRIKEFEIMVTPELVKELELKAEIIDQSLKDRELPDIPFENKSDPPCRWCDYKTLCWEDEPTFEEVDNR